ncbi:MAG: RNA methyltransferase [Candidatus Margulisiibacteriota bacterium]
MTAKMAKVYIALIHYPVYNKRKHIVATNITGFDLHDIARACATYGVERFFVVNPISAQLEFAGKIIDCWKSEKSYRHNWTRAKAFRKVKLAATLEEVLKKLKKPIVVATSAKAKGGASFKALRSKMKKSKRPFLILLGTGWGMTNEVLDKADICLERIKAKAEYNHLSVRSAAAIILDRLLS